MMARVYICYMHKHVTAAYLIQVEPCNAVLARLCLLCAKHAKDVKLLVGLALLIRPFSIAFAQVAVKACTIVQSMGSFHLLWHPALGHFGSA